MNFGYTSDMHLLPAFTSAPARNRVYHMDALALLRALPSESVHCIVTSPPYFGLRDYGVAGQIGLEDTPQAYIARLVAVFREVQRVLRADGTCWVNMGDSYAGSPRGNTDVENFTKPRSAGGLGWTVEHAQRGLTDYRFDKTKIGFKPKDLLMMPARLAIALQDDGWYLRSEIVWHKPNPMPESVTDRPTKAHEMVYLLAKAATYWYDADAIREPNSEGSIARFGITANGSTRKWETSNNKRDDRDDGTKSNEGFRDHVPLNRNRRSVWSIATEATPFAHFATFPRKLIEPMILAGCPARTCGVCGKGWVREVEDTPEYAIVKSNMLGKTHVANGLAYGKGQGYGEDKARVTRSIITLGFHPGCTCHAATTQPGLILDPFMGSGTTALVARSLGRDFIGCDVSLEYVELARQRLAQPYTPPMFETLGIAV